MRAKWLTAAFLYFAAIFALGFVLGTIRVLWVVPALGSETLAVAVELPVMLGASWWTARWLVRRHGVTATAHRAMMGALAFALLLAAEAVLGVTLFGETLVGWAASLIVVPGLLGLVAQIGFGLMPLAVAQGRRRG